MRNKHKLPLWCRWFGHKWKYNGDSDAMVEYVAAMCFMTDQTIGMDESDFPDRWCTRCWWTETLGCSDPALRTPTSKEDPTRE